MKLQHWFRILALRFRARQRHDIEHLLGEKARDVRLYEKALRHSSDLQGEHVTASNERLEFLGDAVLNLLVADYLYQEFPLEMEGFLTQLRAKLVSGQALAKLAEELDLGSLIAMSDDMLNAGGRSHHGVLADCLEAVIGALYLDRGLAATRRFIYRTMLARTDLELLAATTENHKSQLLEYAQARGWSQPKYRVVQERGPGHSPSFTVEVEIGGEPLGRGIGSNKKAAEKQAAQRALEQLVGP